MKNSPPSGSVECWSELTMFAPRAGQEPGDRGDDAVPVGAGDEQAAVHSCAANAATIRSASGWRPPDGTIA
jgi:hypothetical protein